MPDAAILREFLGALLTAQRSCLGQTVLDPHAIAGLAQHCDTATASPHDVLDHLELYSVDMFADRISSRGFDHPQVSSMQVVKLRVRLPSLQAALGGLQDHHLMGIALGKRARASDRHSLITVNSATGVNGLRRQRDAPSSSAILRKSGAGELRLANA